MFADSNLTEVEVNWAVSQDFVTAYRCEDRRASAGCLRCPVIGSTSRVGGIEAVGEDIETTSRRRIGVSYEAGNVECTH